MRKVRSVGLSSFGVFFRNLSLIFCGLIASLSMAAADPLKIVYASEWPPYSQGDGDDVQGILPSLTQALIGEKMGIQIAHQGVPWARAQLMIEKGLADAFVTTPTPKRLKYSIRSENTLYEMGFTPFVKKNSPVHVAIRNGAKIPVDLENFRFCDVLGNGWAKHYYKKNKLEYKEVPIVETCIKMMERGRMDVLIHPAQVVNRVLTNLSLKEKFISFSAVPESPQFVLLVSKKSRFDHLFIQQFDEMMTEVFISDLYDNLLKEIHLKFGG